MSLPISDVIVSVYIRPTARERNQFDNFKFTLQTYSLLPYVERVYLFVALDQVYAARWSELCAHAKDVFGGHLQFIVPFRYTTQSQWRPFLTLYLNEMRQYFPPYERPLVYFTQNDDHPYVDFSDGVLEEGLRIIAARDARDFVAIQISH